MLSNPHRGAPSSRQARAARPPPVVVAHRDALVAGAALTASEAWDDPSPTRVLVRGGAGSDVFEDGYVVVDVSRHPQASGLNNVPPPLPCGTNANQVLGQAALRPELDERVEGLDDHVQHVPACITDD